MSAIHRVSFEEFLKLPEEPGKHYELNEGELVMEPSPAYWHNRIRNRIARRLEDFVQEHSLGEISMGIDFRLDSEVVRNPDVAFVTMAQLRVFDIERSPIEGAPALAVEVISPSNSAEDMLLKVHQYLRAGCKAVWVVYPILKTIVVHDSEGTREVQSLLEESKPFAGIKFTLPFSNLFD